MKVQYEIKIKGRVQGVGFRDFVRRKAAEFNIKGWVKNTRDDVLIMARGDEKDMETFMDHLKRGPSRAIVKDMNKTKMPGLDDFSGFKIRF